MCQYFLVSWVLFTAECRPGVPAGVPNIPGMDYHDGKLFFNGDEVKSISSVDDGGKKEVIDLQEVIRKEDVLSKQPVISKLPVSSLQEVINREEVTNLDELKSIDEISRLEEVINIKDLVGAPVEVPDNYARRFIKSEGLRPVRTLGRGSRRNRLPAIGPQIGSDQGGDNAEIERVRSELTDTLGEINDIQEVLKKLEVKHLEEVQNIREVKTAQEISRMDEIRQLEEVEKIEEVKSMEEVLNKQLVKSMQPVTNIEEVVNKWELTDELARELKRRIAGGI